MTWIGIIIWVIMKIPDFIKIIQAIIDLIRSLPRAQQESYRIMISTAIRTNDKEHVKRCLNLCHSVLQQNIKP